MMRKLILILSIFTALVSYGQTKVPCVTDSLTAKANAGDPVAQYDLGYAYYASNGIENYERNTETALSWFRKSADQGYAPAMFMAGECLQFGKSKNVNLANQYYQNAIDVLNSVTDEQLEADSRQVAILGLIYYFGRCTPIDYDNAALCFEIAADSGEWMGNYYLAECYVKGRGKTKDSNKAKEYYLKAAEQGEMSAINTLGYWAEEAGDYAEAERWYKKAADAKNMWGRMYYANLLTKGGNGIEKNIAKAIEYLLPEAVKKEKFYPVERLADAYRDLGDYQNALKWYEVGFDYGSEYSEKQYYQTQNLIRENRNAQWKAENRKASEALYKSRDFVGRALGDLDKMQDTGYITNVEKVYAGSSLTICNITLKDGSRYRIETNSLLRITKAQKLK